MKKILIANRGEIALRIIRACRDAGYVSIAIASEADTKALHALAADELHVLSGTSPLHTYLNQEAVLEIAKQSGADAVHPGYGFLSENEQFAASVEAAGLIWIGPSAKAIAMLGDKVAARSVAKKVGAPLLPSYDEAHLTLETAQSFAAQHGFPVIIKAQNGGGGRGMRIVRTPEDLEPQLAAATREAKIAFGRPECFIERYVEHARHVETQCLADAFGNVLVLSTRDCTLQRRQQKLVEEAPAPFLSEQQIAQLTASSVDILKAVDYRGAATCEFLITQDGAIFFLEVNTRVQVEHPVTEQVTDIDIIRQMFNIAEGKKLDIEVPQLRRHSIEFRINAEDPWADFAPIPGKIRALRLPGGPGVRIDFGYAQGDTIPPYYDSLIGKLIITGSDRADALQRARRALAEFAAVGIKTIVPLHRAILERAEFSATQESDFTVHTRWIDQELSGLCAEAKAFEQFTVLETDEQGSFGTTYQVQGAAQEELPTYTHGVHAPLSGMILDICVNEGDMIQVGEVVAIMESMKMEQAIIAEVAGVVAKINVEKGAFIEMGADIMGVD
ncbi:acetyl/propionyl/methylcrotonyl-CoA carboxylase subunit alpha [Pseudomonas sp. O230]|uniref:acetyl/propionyl/methylcrotonyl-CoA carboxylase subunit alpha n=1 Tax=Pseudomonas sp. O230 TaxID=3159450 RepID=UPI00387AD0C2